MTIQEMLTEIEAVISRCTADEYDKMLSLYEYAPRWEDRMVELEDEWDEDDDEFGIAP